MSLFDISFLELVAVHYETDEVVKAKKLAAAKSEYIQFYLD